MIGKTKVLKGTKTDTNDQKKSIFNIVIIIIMFEPLTFQEQNTSICKILKCLNDTKIYKKIY